MNPIKMPVAENGPGLVAFAPTTHEARIAARAARSGT